MIICGAVVSNLRQYLRNYTAENTMLQLINPQSLPRILDVFLTVIARSFQKISCICSKNTYNSPGNHFDRFEVLAAHPTKNLLHHY